MWPILVAASVVLLPLFLRRLYKYEPIQTRDKHIRAIVSFVACVLNAAFVYALETYLRLDAAMECILIFVECVILLGVIFSIAPGIRDRMNKYIEDFANTPNTH